MALISLYLEKTQRRTTIKDNNTDVDILPIDATIQRTTNYENEVTQFPVEDGNDVTDHVRTKPITINIDGVISDTPLTIESQKAALVTSGGSFVSQNLGGFKGGAASTLAGIGAGKLGSKLFQSSNETQVLGQKIVGSPAEVGRKTLELLIKSKQRFKIVIGNTMLNNMVMTRLTIPEDNQIGQALKFSATFQEIRVVSGQTVEIKRIARSVAHSGSKKTSLGAQSTTVAEAPQAKSTSILYGLLGKK